MKNIGVKFGAIKNASKKFILVYPDYARASYYFRSGTFELSTDMNNADAKEVVEFNKMCYEQ